MPYNPSCAEEEQFLKDFDPSKYEKPAVAADTALFAVDGNALKILLIKRGGYPCKGRWAAPGGFVDMEEDIIECAARELEEETGIAGVYIEQAFAWGEPDRDPRQRVITVSHISVADYSQIKPKAGDDAAEAAWFEIKEYKKTEKDGFCYIDYVLEGPETLRPSVRFPSGRMQKITPVNSGGLAFDHAESIAYSFETLKARVEHGTFLEQALHDEALREKARRVILGM
jgi:8-oxo-dGTP diphosphatase